MRGLLPLGSERRQRALTRSLRSRPLPDAGEVKESRSTKTAELVLAALFMRPSFACDHDDAKNRIAPRKSKREAERRKAHAIHVRVAQASARELAPTSSAPRLRALSGHAQPSALTLAVLAIRLSPRWLSPRTGFPENGPHRCFARLALLSSVSTAVRPVFLPVDREPRAARHQGLIPHIK